ncbi:hypothetical protein GQ53DRAFT_130334 [Thozetella sp. PMI_491]|nr:hypothetical protein GQ53DRAFT_130334 [Thozetella sp. PMI_491]
MCYHVVELYAACRCLYYQHPIDRCASYGCHPVQRRTILVGYSCAEHSKQPILEAGLPSRECDDDSSAEEPSPLDTPASPGIQFKWRVIPGPQARTLHIAATIRLPLLPFDYPSWAVYLLSLPPQNSGLSTWPSSLNVNISIGKDSLLDVTSFHTSQSEDATGDPELLPTAPIDFPIAPKSYPTPFLSAATKSSFFPSPSPASLFSCSNGSSTDLSEHSSWPENGTDESDDQSSSAPSESSDILEDGHYFTVIKTELLEIVLGQFHAHQRGSHSSQGSGRPPSNGPSTSGRGDSRNQPRGKRSRSVDDSDDSAQPEDSQVTKRQRPPAKHELLFACTFFKKDPVKHRACEKAGQKRIRDVKQHLRRKHFFPFYCSRCWCIFDSELQRDDHTRAQDCQLRPEEVRDQLSLTQVMALQRKVNHKLTPTMQWFSVWDICFPGVPYPNTPYIDPELSEQLSSFHAFYTEHGPDIIIGALNQRNMLHWDLPNEERDLAAFRRSILHEALNRIYEDWLESRHSAVPTTAPSTVDSTSGSDTRLGESQDGSPVEEPGSIAPSFSDAERSFAADLDFSEWSRSAQHLEMGVDQYQLESQNLTLANMQPFPDYPDDQFYHNDITFDFERFPGDALDGLE